MSTTRTPSCEMLIWQRRAYLVSDGKVTEEPLVDPGADDSPAPGGPSIVPPPGTRPLHRRSPLRRPRPSRRRSNEPGASGAEESSSTSLKALSWRSWEGMFS